MLKQRRVVALIPARGGSKGLPGKNMLRFGGLTLVERAALLARKAGFADVIYVSTDNAELHAAAKAAGCATPYLRPAALATDSARTIDVLANLVEQNTMSRDDVVLLLQPTSPLRASADLVNAKNLFEREWDRADAVVSVVDADGAPYKAQTVESGYLRSLVGRDSTVARQSLPKSFLPNGAIYFGKVDTLLDENTFTPKRSLPYEMPAERSVNLDTPLDLVMLEAMLAKGIAHLEDDESGAGRAERI